MSQNKEYIITYRSKEHFEVLGWILASSLEEAKKEAKAKLLPEAKKYKVEEAEIAEWENGSKISFSV